MVVEPRKHCPCGGAFVHQYAGNKIYRTYCETCGKAPTQVIPQEPEKIKKRSVVWLWLTNFWRKDDQ